MSRLIRSIAALPIAAALVWGGTALAEDKAPAAYPLKTCVVSGEELGEMGDPYVIQHEGREVRLCCKSCEKNFRKDPAKYIKKLDEAAKAAPATQPAE